MKRSDLFEGYKYKLFDSRRQPVEFVSHTGDPKCGNFKMDGITSTFALKRIERFWDKSDQEAADAAILQEERDQEEHRQVEHIMKQYRLLLNNVAENCGFSARFSLSKKYGCKSEDLLSSFLAFERILQLGEEAMQDKISAHWRGLGIHE